MDIGIIVVMFPVLVYAVALVAWPFLERWMR